VIELPYDLARESIHQDAGYDAIACPDIQQAQAGAPREAGLEQRAHDVGCPGAIDQELVRLTEEELDLGNALARKATGSRYRTWRAQLRAATLGSRAIRQGGRLEEQTAGDIHERVPVRLTARHATNAASTATRETDWCRIRRWPKAIRL
jgi:hypothetical protein